CCSLLGFCWQCSRVASEQTQCAERCYQIAVFPIVAIRCHYQMTWCQHGYGLLDEPANSQHKPFVHY
ncbi:MAG: hypothetical protein PHY54_17050, partial [Methylococcales bacterium]|nr:hypothetical protein [Methylococcales bacterium]